MSHHHHHHHGLGHAVLSFFLILGIIGILVYFWYLTIPVLVIALAAIAVNKRKSAKK